MKSENEYLIEGYDKDELFITVNYLNGHKAKLDNTKENEKFILDQMLKQAVDRNTVLLLSDTYMKRNDALYKGTVSLIFASLLNMTYSINDSSILKIIITALTTITSIDALINLYEVIANNKKISKFKKMNSYLLNENNENTLKLNKKIR